jgi:hypothetical protein
MLTKIIATYHKTIGLVSNCNTEITELIYTTTLAGRSIIAIGIIAENELQSSKIRLCQSIDPMNCHTTELTFSVVKRSIFSWL